MLHGELLHVEAVRFSASLRHLAEVNRHCLLRYGTLMHFINLILQRFYALWAVHLGLRRSQVPIPLPVCVGNLQLSHA